MVSLTIALLCGFFFTQTTPPNFDLMFSEGDCDIRLDASIDIGRLKNELFDYCRGFFFGDTTDAVPGKVAELNMSLLVFDCIVSIELDAPLFLEASKRFIDCPFMQVLSEDSSTIVGTIISCAHGRILFWINEPYMEQANIRNDNFACMLDALHRQKKIIAGMQFLDSQMLNDAVQLPKYSNFFQQNTVRSFYQIYPLCWTSSRLFEFI